MLALLLIIVILGAVIVAMARVIGQYRAVEASTPGDRDAARIRQEARDASWEIHRRVSGALAEMMDVARDAQLRDRDQRR